MGNKHRASKDITLKDKIHWGEKSWHTSAFLTLTEGHPSRISSHGTMCHSFVTLTTAVMLHLFARLFD